jgi:hypothetical protein
MKKFEYKIHQGQLTETQLNSLGKEGWKLITHTVAGERGHWIQHYIFIRERL